MQINPVIARQIITRTMKIIKHSVNVMDEHGLIIGSGDESRLHQRHEGAVLVLAENRVVEIDAATACTLKGVQPGINLPILFQNQVIGVIGISGEPQAVRHYGELVKMTAELIIEQAALMSQREWHKRQRENLVLQLIQTDRNIDEPMRSAAALLDIDLTQPRIACIVQVRTDLQDSPVAGHLQRLVGMLEYPERDNLVAISAQALNEVVVLKPITLPLHPQGYLKEQQRVKKLFRRIEKEGHFHVRIALGDYFACANGLALSYQTARATLACAAPHDDILFFHQHRLPALLHSLREEGWQQQQLLAPLWQLKAVDPHGTLEQTLRCYFAHNCDQAQTSKTLQIHRNTLRYRLMKIEEITSLKFNEIMSETHLYLAHILSH